MNSFWGQKLFSKGLVLLVFVVSSYLTGLSNIPIALAAPAAPTNLTATAISANSIRLDWQDNSDNEDWFVIFQGLAADSLYQFASVVANSTTYQMNTIEGTTYYFQVKACSGIPCNYSNGSNIASATSYLYTPTDLKASAVSNTVVNLSWKDNTNTESNYVVERKEGTENWQIVATLPAGTIKYTNTDLAYDGNHTYSYQVKAIRQSNGAVSPYSNTASVTTPPPPYSNLPNPTTIGFIPTLESVSSLKTVGDKIFVYSAEYGLEIIDAAIPAQMKILGAQHPYAGKASGILAVSGNTVVVGNTDRGTDIVDVADYTYPRVVASIPSTDVTDVEIKGQFAYIVDKNGIHIADISTPAAAREIATFHPTSGTPVGLAFSDNLGVLSVSLDAVNSRLDVLNISNPISLVAIESISFTAGTPGPLAFSSNLVVISFSKSPGKLMFVNVSATASPVKVGEYSFGVSDYTVLVIKDIVISNNLIYVAVSEPSWMGGLYIIDVSAPATPILKSIYSGETLPRIGVSNVDALGNVANVSTIETNGSAIVNLNVSDPTNPKSTGNKFSLPPAATPNNMVFSGNLAILPQETDADTQIINIANPTKPTLLSTIPGKSMSVAAAGNIAYIGRTNLSSFRVFDITNPSAPNQIGFLDNVSGSSLALYGQFVAANAVPLNGRSAFGLIDVSNPRSPRVRGSISYCTNPSQGLWGVPIGSIAIAGDCALVPWTCYGNNGTSINSRELTMVDLRNPDNLQIVKAILFETPKSIRVINNVAYALTDVQLSLLDVSNPANLSVLSSIVSDGTSPLYGLAIYNNVAYVSEQRVYIDGSPIGPRHIISFDVSDPANPKRMPTNPPAALGSILQLAESGGKLYAVGNFFEVYDFYNDTLKVTKSTPTYKAKSGDEITYTLTIENPSPNVSSNLVLNEPIPVNTRYIAGSATPGVTCVPTSCDNTASVLKWAFPKIFPAAKIEVSFKVKVN